MQNVQLSDQLYQQAQRRAAAAGFASVDAYIADVLQDDLCEAAEDFDRLFTPERLAHIDRAIAQLDAGQGLTSEKAKAELARRRGQWLRENAR